MELKGNSIQSVKEVEENMEENIVKNGYELKKAPAAFTEIGRAHV